MGQCQSEEQEAKFAVTGLVIDAGGCSSCCLPWEQDFLCLLLHKHTLFLNTSTSYTALWHLLYKLLIASKWGRYDIHECKRWKDELMWAQGAVFSSQVSTGAYTDFCLSDATSVSAPADGCLWAPGEPGGSTWPYTECGHAPGTRQPEPTLALGNEKRCAPSCYTFGLKYGRNAIGFTTSTNQAQPRECFTSLYIEGMRRETSFYIKKALSRHHLSAEDCVQACFVAGHWGQQPSSTICV